MNSHHRFLRLALMGLFIPLTLPAQNLGYNDTPRIPGSKWRVHDGDRPQPILVTPGTASTQERAGTAPSDAIVLFAGEDLGSWTGRGDRAGWKVKNGYMEVNGTGDIRSRQEFGDCQLHIEWATPEPPSGTSQGSGNSGVFLMGRYEIQVLNSHDNETYPDGHAAAVYGQSPPLVNASRKPGAWPTFDIIFTAPRFRDGELLQPARVTVIHNGVLVHHAKEILGPTAHRRAPAYEPHGPSGPLVLQDHGNPMRFRNIWVRRIEDYDQG